EVAQTIPERDIERGGLLRLECDDAANGFDRRDRFARKQHLSLERGPIELSGADHTSSGLRYSASSATTRKPHASYRCSAPVGFWESTPRAPSVMPASLSAVMVAAINARARPRRRHGFRTLMCST